jgi:hypothetical protein
LCLASFKTAAGFGNCVVVQQGVGGGAAAGAANNGNTAAGKLVNFNMVCALLTE